MKLIFPIVLAVLVSGCVSYSQNSNGNDDNVINECAIDSDCVVVGCSRQLCVPQSQSDIITTCEYKAEYQCLGQTSCSCIQGICGWENTTEYTNCLEQAEDIGPIV